VTIRAMTSLHPIYTAWCCYAASLGPEVELSRPFDRMPDARIVAPPSHPHFIYRVDQKNCTPTVSQLIVLQYVPIKLVLSD